MENNNLNFIRQGDCIQLMKELDEKYASVILRRFVEDTGKDAEVYVIRNGEKLMYKDFVKEVDFGDGETE